MTKPKYTSPAARKAAQSASARKQMRAQWERQRQESGQELGYYGCHRRVRKERGRAGDLTCVECGKQAQHWAHVHDTDPADPQNYQPMCQSCHWIYDDVAATRGRTLGAEGRSAIAVKAWETKYKAWEAKYGKQAGDVAPDSPLAGPG